MKLLSWNVNGMRAILKKGFWNFLKKYQPDILALQETKVHPSQLAPDCISPPEYLSYWHSADIKKGYSGTALFSKVAPADLKNGTGNKDFDGEGRTIRADFGSFVLYNVYFPNGKASPERLKFKMDFYENFLKLMKQELEDGKQLIVCGDFNTAHQEIDLARPKENEDISGFLPIERAWMDRFCEAGFTDSLRVFHKEPGLYSWWSMRSGARQRNVGWRIDYFFVSHNLSKHLKNAFILSDVSGSDHCPVGVELKI